MSAPFGPLGTALRGLRIALPLAGLIAAWDPSLGSGSDISALRPAMRTKQPLAISGSAGSADIVAAVSPSGRNMLQTTASNSEVAAIPGTGLMTTATLAYVFAPTDLSATVPVVSKNASATQSYIVMNVASNQIFRFTIVNDAGSGGATNLLTGQLMNKGGSYLVVIILDGTNVRIRVNGVETSAARTGSFQFDRIFKGNAVFGSGMWGRGAIWNRVLSASELAILEGPTGFGDDISTALYVSKSQGDDTTKFGFSINTPLKTIAAANAKTQVIANGLINGHFYIRLNDADTFTAEACTPAVAGLDASHKVIYEPYPGGGDGYVKCHGVAAQTTGVTDNGDGTYSIAVVGYSPGFFQLATGSSAEGLKFEKLYDKGRGTPPGTTWYQWTANVLTFKPPGYYVLNVTPYYVSPVIFSAQSRCFDFGVGFVKVRKFVMYLWAGICFRPAVSSGTSTVETEDCECSYGGDDGMDAQSAPTVQHIYTDPKFHANGLIPRNSGQGDGASAHNQANVAYIRPRAFYNLLGGIENESHTTWSVDGGLFINNGYDIIQLDQGSGSAAGSATIRSTLIRPGANSLNGNAIEIQAATTGSSPNLEVSGVTIVNEGAGGAANAIAFAGGTGIVQDTVMDGFNGGVTRTAGTMSEGHNDFHNVNFPTQGTVTQLGGDITTDPLFTNPGAHDYSLPHNSPCRAAGIAVAGLDTDYNGTLRPNPPTIGFVEAA